MNTDEISISVIIPTYQRHAALLHCLNGFTSQVNAPNYEILVIHDGIVDSDADELRRHFPVLPLRVFSQPHAGPAAARNTGAAHARGRYLVFLDDDCQPTPDWLQMINNCLQQYPHMLIGGQTRNGLPAMPCAEASQILVDYLYHVYNRPGGRTGFFTSNNFSLARVEFHAIKGFDPSFPLAAAEDRDFCARWLANGRQMQYCANVRVLHFHPLNLKKFIRQHFHYGRGAYQFHCRLVAQQQTPPKMESLRFYWNLITFCNRPMHFLARMRLVVLLIISQAANAAGFFWEAQQQ